MMNLRLLPNPLTRLGASLLLLAVFLASCAPAAPTVNPAPVAARPTATLPAPASDSGQTQPVTAEATQAAAPTPLPVATSRGPNLEATDPTTVSLASGQLQFVEFFRFT